MVSEHLLSLQFLALRALNLHCTVAAWVQGYAGTAESVSNEIRSRCSLQLSSGGQLGRPLLRGQRFGFMDSRLSQTFGFRDARMEGGVENCALKLYISTDIHSISQHAYMHTYIGRLVPYKALGCRRPRHVQQWQSFAGPFLGEHPEASDGKFWDPGPLSSAFGLRHRKQARNLRSARSEYLRRDQLSTRCSSRIGLELK